jgi:hypothetical protein
MANTIELGDRVMVEVAPNVAKTMLSIDGELAQLGVRVHKVQVAHKAAGVVNAIKTAWVAYSILKEARNQWPTIRKILVNAGLSNSEIITLGLSQYTKKKPAKKKKKKR